MRIQHVLFALHTVAFVASFTAAEQSDSAGDLPIQVDEGLQKKVDAYFAPLVESKLFAGSVLLSRDGRVLVRKSYGLANEETGELNTPETRFKLMSTSKTFTAVAIMTLIEDGKLTMDQVIGNSLDGCPAAWKGVTIRQLLSHTSNIPNLAMSWGVTCLASQEFGLPTWAKFASKHGNSELTTLPEETSSYSNFNYVLLGLVIEAVSGQSYQHYVRERVLRPAGLTQSGFANGGTPPGLSLGYFRGPNGSLRASQQNMAMIQAAGGLYSSVDDLFRYDRALADDRLLDRETRKLMFKPITRRFGGGWEVLDRAGRRCVSHSGGANGYVANFLRFPDDDACIAVQSNFAFAPIGPISRDLTSILFGGDYKTVQPPTEKTLADAPGVYRQVNGDSLIIIRRSGKTIIAFELDLQAENNFGRLLIPYPGEVFAQPIGGASIRLFKLPNGEHALNRTSGQRTDEFERLAHAAEWDLVGAYEVDGFRIKVERQQGCFVITGPHASMRRSEIIPVSDDLALAIRMETQAEIVKPIRSEDALPSGFTWRPIGGRLRTATRLE